MSQPLAINGNLVIFISNYGNISTVKSFGNVLTAANTKVAANVFSVANENAIGNLVCSYQPLLNQYTAANITYQYTTALNAHMQSILPNDYSIFAQVFDLSRGYCQQTNGAIESANRANNYLGTTFTSMDDLVTGGFSSVSTDLPTFGLELKKTGNTINLQVLDLLGLPSQLLLNIKKQGQGFIGFETELLAAGVTSDTIKKIGRNGFTITNTIEHNIFLAMQKVTGTSLKQILTVLGCTVSNVANLSQLLDLKVLLPLSYKSLLAPTSTGSVKIYNTDGSVASQWSNIAPQLSIMTTPALASSNTAFAKSLKHIKGIDTKTIPKIADVVAGLKINTGLTDINALKSPLVPGAANVFSGLGQGTGTGGTYVLGDVIGSVAGLVLNANWPNVIANTTTIVSSNVANTLTNTTNGVFTVMVNTLNGLYGPPTGPIEGMPTGPWSAGEPYANLNLAFSTASTGLIAVAQTYISNVTANITSQYSTQAANGTAGWTKLVNKLITENQAIANLPVPISDITHGTATTMFSWVTSFSDYAKDSEPGGAKDVILGVVDSTTLSGQSVIATLRESENIAKLKSAGIQSDNQIGQYTPMMINTASFLSDPPTS